MGDVGSWDCISVTSSCKKVLSELAAVWAVLEVELVAVFAWAATVEGRVLASD
jgi:hypothetical protein